MRRTSIPSAVVLALALAAGCNKSETKAPPAEPPKPEEPKKPEPPKHPVDPGCPADAKAVPADAEKTATGLASKVLTAGTGKEHPAREDTVKVHYTGWMTDCWKFDSSVDRHQPASFPLNGVIPGWTE